MSNLPTENNFYKAIIKLLKVARKEAVQSVDRRMVIAYFEVGKMIVEKEQEGERRAKYGTYLLRELSIALTKEFGRGFSRRNLEQMRKLYIVYSKAQKSSAKLQSIDFQLSWSHYLTLVRIENEAERRFYEIEAIKNKWGVNELKRQYNSALYTRLTLSRDKDKVKELSEKGLVIENPEDAIKDPYILEFLGLPEHPSYSESELEQELINKLEYFLLEQGTGFTYVARQKRISFDDKHFRIDLVFYNRILRCFVLFDLKIGELKHQDIGQMQMYVHYYDRELKLPEENKTIGVILCQNKSEAVVEYTLPEGNEQIFASKYKTVLPTKEELKALLKAKNS